MTRQTDEFAVLAAQLLDFIEVKHVVGRLFHPLFLVLRTANVIAQPEGKLPQPPQRFLGRHARKCKPTEYADWNLLRDVFLAKESTARREQVGFARTAYVRVSVEEST